ncbi:MAG TPA: hypothetical protein VK034_28715 [Enhygromyxa sp.]|nr:hypothetical protein [Enhygromyxa sp.]
MATLTDRLGRRIPDARGFALMGEDLLLIGGDDLLAAGQAWQRELDERVPAAMQPAFSREQAAAVAEAHRFTRRYNISLADRIRGYLELAERLDHQYPWPIVAILGLMEVRGSLTRFGALTAGSPLLARLGGQRWTRMADRTLDALRRTNRGIFADSVPLILYALHVRALERDGQSELARLLAAGPLPPIWDASQAVVLGRLLAGLAEPDPERRFRSLADLTLDQFEREQQVFTHQLGGDRPTDGKPNHARSRGPAAWLQGWLAPPQVSAPRIEGPAGARRLVFAPTPLPPGFDLRDHGARVELFSQIFVRSVLGSQADYHAAARWCRVNLRA